MNRRISHYIFRAKITLKDGTVLRAKDYGLKAFKIPVYDDGTESLDIRF